MIKDKTVLILKQCITGKEVNDRFYEALVKLKDVKVHLINPVEFEVCDLNDVAKQLSETPKLNTYSALLITSKRALQLVNPEVIIKRWLNKPIFCMGSSTFSEFRKRFNKHKNLEKFTSAFTNGNELRELLVKHKLENNAVSILCGSAAPGIVIKTLEIYNVEYNKVCTLVCKSATNSIQKTLESLRTLNYVVLFSPNDADHLVQRLQETDRLYSLIFITLSKATTDMLLERSVDADKIKQTTDPTPESLAILIETLNSCLETEVTE
ncbi:hypothetical protein GJ496_001998 [Pomphorhynchus laevis]|nr:hypothetical protein GJ496_001998 [Pomphorhynchus laevis]